MYPNRSIGASTNMDKHDLKHLVTQMYDKLIDKINEQEDVEKADVICYLRESLDAIIDMPTHIESSVDVLKCAFDDKYREIANKGIYSYQHTNQRFETLTQMHEETLNTCSQQETINIPEITSKFNDIQNHMVDEIKKANEIILKLSNQVDILEKESLLDSLTKVFNRRALTAYLNNICSKENFSKDLHLAILDIDDFKEINDKHGHIAGDKILIFIAKILKKTLRDSDKIYRYGGEEFILILNRIDMEHCQKIILRILEMVNKNQLIYKGENISVTVSIGTTALISDDTPDSLIHRADNALYRAKKNGKNRFEMELVDGN